MPYVQDAYPEVSDGFDNVAMAADTALTEVLLSHTHIAEEADTALDEAVWSYTQDALDVAEINELCAA